MIITLRRYTWMSNDGAQRIAQKAIFFSILLALIALCGTPTLATNLPSNPPTNQPAREDQTVQSYTPEPKTFSEFTVSETNPAENLGTFFSGRTNLAATVHQGRMWVIGGNYSGGAANAISDVWSSGDGATWKYQAKTATMSAPSCVELNGSIWLIGDSPPYPYYGLTFWRSTDGINWTQLTPTSVFPTRSSQGCAVFNNRIWVVGGTDGYSYSTEKIIQMNDVWSSADGENWTQHTANAGFSPRYNHACVTFKNLLWVVGGHEANTDPHNQFTMHNDVWSSSDGANWTCTTATAPFTGREQHTCMAFNDRLWVIGGLDANGKALNDVWSSSDGVTWRMEQDSAAFPPRYGHASVVFDNKMWVIGGFSPLVIGSRFGYYRNDAWYSSDGVQWNRATGFTLLQEAIDQAAEGAVVTVPPGRYCENILINKNIVLRSQNPLDPSVVGSTIIEGRTGGSPITLNVLVGEQSCLAGFTITQEYASYSLGTGIDGQGSKARIENNRIIGNSALGMFYLNSLQAMYGGGLRNCDGIIQNNVIANNRSNAGGGLYQCNGLIQNNILYGNTVSDIYGAYPHSGTHCLFRSYGSAMAECRGIIRNNTILAEAAHGDDFSYSGNSSVVFQSGGSFVNNIIWPRDPDKPLPWLSTLTDPRYCCIKGWTGGGAGNISNDPKFVDPTNNNYHLLPSSSCIDAGQTTSGLTLDFDGDQRGLTWLTGFHGDGSYSDIGADEFAPTSIQPFFPNESRQLMPGEVFSAYWLSQPISGTAVRMTLMRNGRTVADLGFFEAADKQGVAQMTLPKSLAGGTNYSIRCISVYDERYWNDSMPFTILSSVSAVAPENWMAYP